MPDSQTLPEHVTTPLLTLITQNSLDEDYQHVADRKAEEADQPVDAKAPRRRAAVVAAVFGLLIVTAAVQTSRNAETAEAGREELIDQINARSDQVRAQQGTISDLREVNAQLTNRLETLTDNERNAQARLLRAQGITGYAPVTGPGVRITVDNSPAGDSDGIVRDEDLAVLVDGLWAAGADAISINGQRLTALTPIRSVSRAIHIATTPIRPPYTVLAIGDRNRLQADFAQSQHGVLWFNLRQNFGFEFDMRNADSVSLPGRRTSPLRSAEPADLAPNDRGDTP
ncbi:MAG TPA: DUF881 domain-containing protein [Intrasporangium sp.]|nr:DUF881 domain-containing protein [Intrasporangium sp.]